MAVTTRTPPKPAAAAGTSHAGATATAYEPLKFSSQERALYTLTTRAIDAYLPLLVKLRGFPEGGAINEAGTEITNKGNKVLYTLTPAERSAWSGLQRARDQVVTMIARAHDLKGEWQANGDGTGIEQQPKPATGH